MTFSLALGSHVVLRRVRVEQVDAAGYTLRPVPSARETHLQGELQVALMHVLWRVGEASVQEARNRLPRRFRDSAYTTVQTVLNRLAGRGLVARRRKGRAIAYTPKVSEADYYSRSLRDALAPASSEARRSVLAQLVGDLKPSERAEIESLVVEARRRRKQ